MTVILELPSETASHLQSRAMENGLSLPDYLIRIAEADAADFAASVAAVRRGFADLDAGRTLPFEEFVAQEQAKRDERCAQREIVSRAV